MSLTADRVFLGGTVNNTTWREELIKKLKISYFNPVVVNWDYASRLNEEREKDICKYHAYVISPMMTGLFSIAELVDRVIKFPDTTVFTFLKEDEDSVFDDDQWKSIVEVIKLCQKNGGRYFSTLDDMVQWLNNISTYNNLKYK